MYQNKQTHYVQPSVSASLICKVRIVEQDECIQKWNIYTNSVDQD